VDGIASKAGAGWQVSIAGRSMPLPPVRTGCCCY
jgi:hypothetical protein